MKTLVLALTLIQYQPWAEPMPPLTNDPARNVEITGQMLDRQMREQQQQDQMDDLIRRQNRMQRQLDQLSQPHF